MNRTTNHPATYVRGVDKKVDEQFEKHAFFPSGGPHGNREMRRHPNLFIISELGQLIRLSRKKFRKQPNNRSNANGGRLRRNHR